MASNFNKWGSQRGQTAIRVKGGFILTGWNAHRDWERTAIRIPAKDLDDMISELLRLRKRTGG
jgi:hypothetical protein